MEFPEYFLKFDISADERADIFDKTLWAKEFNWDEMIALSNYFSFYKIKAGHKIFEQGDTAQFMGFIFEGAVRISKEDSKAKKQVLSVVKDNKLLGEMALIDKLPRSAGADTLQDTKIFILTEEKFGQLKQNHPTIWGKLLFIICKLLSYRLRATSGALIDRIDK